MKQVLLIILILTLWACAPTTEGNKPNYDYSDVTTSIIWDDIFKQEEESYLVYFYKTTCAHCKEIKEEILDFYFENTVTMYFVECSENAIYGNPSDLTLVDNVENFYIFGTPFLIDVEKWALKDYFAGVTKIREFITNYQ